MNTEFFEALSMLEKEKGISQEYLLDRISNAIAIAVRRDYGGVENVVVDIDPKEQVFRVAIKKTVVDEVFDEYLELTLDEAREIDPDAQMDDVVEVVLDPKAFGRIAAQTAKHVIRQGFREAERNQILEEFESREHEIVTAVVGRIDDRRGFATLEIGKSEALLLKTEQIPGELLREGDRIKVYVVDVSKTDRGPKIMISRTHPGLVKRLFEMEVPEIHSGIIEIMAVSREAGSRTKLAVSSNDPDVDAVGACIGPRGARVTKIVDELCGEKIDVIKYSDDPAEFISAALSPAEVISVEIEDENVKACRVTVPDNQLSLAIGNKGQNVRLAARLTGYKIDIHPESGFVEEQVEQEFDANEA